MEFRGGPLAGISGPLQQESVVHLNRNRWSTSAGICKNFETDASGNMMQLIQAQGYGFKKALDYAGGFLGLSPEIQTLHSPVNTKQQIEVIPPSLDTPDSNDLKAIARAEKIAMQSQVIANTLAERYLREHRGITAKVGAHYRFHPGLFEPQTQQKYPALIAIAKNNKNEAHAVQAIYLDPKTANKAEIAIKKRSFGRLRFGAAVTAGVENSKDVYLAEGPETALSILSAKPEAKVFATLSVSNFSRVTLDKNIKSITLCMDNDGPEAIANKTIEKAINTWRTKGVTVHLVKPEKEKSDFNDLLIERGVTAVKKVMDRKKIVEMEI